MPLNLSIKNAPDDLVERLRLRARRNHRSLQGELMAILEDAVTAPSGRDRRGAMAAVERLGLATPAEAVAMIRKDRDGR
jgi:plasmid stability protein